MSIIIDTDPGTDDAFAIILALKEKLNIKAITTVEGNCSIKQATKNAQIILDVCRRLDIPIYKGKGVNDRVYAKKVHGQDGLGDINYKEIKSKIENKNAVDYLIETVNNNPKKITIIAIGPLTNIKEAIMRNKDFSKNIKELLVMGGTITKGNITEYAEFNFYKDANSAKKVLESDIKNIKLFGLNVTEKLPLLEYQEKNLLESKDKASKFLYKITRTGAKKDREKGFAGLILNDPLPISYIMDKRILKFKKMNVTVQTRGIKKGMLIPSNSRKKIKIATSVNKKRFYRIIDDMIK